VPYCGRPNAFAGLDPFLFRGPITRTVGDAALALATLCGPDPRDPHCLLDDFDPLAALPGSLEGVRIAYSRRLTSSRSTRASRRSSSRPSADWQTRARTSNRSSWS